MGRVNTVALDLILEGGGWSDSMTLCTVVKNWIARLAILSDILLSVGQIGLITYGACQKWPTVGCANFPKKFEKNGEIEKLKKRGRHVV